MDADTKLKLGLERQSRPETRLEALPIDLGEQVVGSRHIFERAALFNRSDTESANVALDLYGSSALTLQRNALTMAPLFHDNSVAIAFAPDHVGEYRATLVVRVAWGDGHTDTQSIDVSARARNIDQAPEDARIPPDPKQSPERSPWKGDRRPLDRGYADALSGLSAAHARLVGRQAKGVDDVSQEAAKYKPPPAPVSIWGELADIALMTGIAGVAAMVGKYAARELAGAAESIALEGVAAGVEDGIKSSAENVIGRHEGGDEGATPNETSGGSGGDKAPQDHDRRGNGGPDAKKAVSRDNEIAFFSAQSEMVADAGGESEKRIRFVAERVIDREPAAASEIIERVAKALDDAKHNAEAEQANATALQWLTYRARLGLGDERIKTPDGERTATTLDKQREIHGLDPVSLAMGVLEIQVTHRPSGQITVQGARVNGIEEATAQRLLDLDLRGSGIPIRFLVNSGIVLTLDEVGRVRKSGPLLDFEMPSPATEAQEIREAERITRIVLGKHLSDWGLEHVATDDAHKRND